MEKKYDLGIGLTFINWLLKQAPAWHEIPVEQARNSHNDFFIRGLAPEVKLHNVENITINGRFTQIPLRIYRPTTKTNMPVVVFYHGGGWVIGSLNSHDHICRTVAKRAEVVVVSVDYRLAPEHPYPAAVEDAADALNWVADNIMEYGGNPKKVFTMGDSAGGNLATVMSLLARDGDVPPITGQVLIYPATDANTEYESRTHFHDAPILDKPTMDYFINTYTPDPSVRSQPTMSPMCADSHADLPPTLIQVAQYDPLIDEGVAYGEKLKADGVDVQLIEYPRMIHGFYSVGAFAGATHQAYQDMVTFIKKYK